jgi:hypothetical protein
METTIAVPHVEVRSGPTAKYYATGELHQGDRVIVVRECKDQPGWLEVKPPGGSFSWVSTKYVKQVNAYEAVVMLDAPALIGSALIAAKPTVEARPGFVAGYLLNVVDRPLTVDGETWLAVSPHRAEVRYIPADAVRPAIVAAPTAPANWAVGTKSNTPPTTTIPGYPTDAKSGGSSTSLSPTPQPPAPAAATYAPQWSNYGILRTTTFTRDGQPMYVLVNRQEQPLLYVTSRPGTSLKSYVNHEISVYGAMVYRPDEYVKTPYMVASHIAVP